MLSTLPNDSYWAFGGIANQQLKATATAIAMGGGVRIGLEDNLTLFGEQVSNLQLINRMKNLAEIHNRTIMTPLEFGNLGFYNLKKRKKVINLY